MIRQNLDDETWALTLTLTSHHLSQVLDDGAIAAVIVIADVVVDVIEPVIVAVHLNGNDPVIVIRPVDV